MDQKAWLYALAASGLVAGIAQRSEPVDAAPQKAKKNVECFGINTCEGKNGCGLDYDRAVLAFKVYPDPEMYKETRKKIKNGEKLGECSGSTDGSAKDGHLAWIDKKNKEDCLKEGGFVYFKDKDGRLKIEDKDGIKDGGGKDELPKDKPANEKK